LPNQAPEAKAWLAKPSSRFIHKTRVVQKYSKL
jgi:hypothetical protein